MKRRQFITLLGGAAALPIAARAQEHKYILAHFSAGPVSPPELWAVFVDALQQLGFVEGKNVTFERRYAEDKLDRLPDLAAELVRMNVDVIVTVGTLAPLAAKQATKCLSENILNLLNRL